MVFLKYYFALRGKNQKNMFPVLFSIQKILYTCDNGVSSAWSPAAWAGLPSPAGMSGGVDDWDTGKFPWRCGKINRILYRKTAYSCPEFPVRSPTWQWSSLECRRRGLLLSGKDQPYPLRHSVCSRAQDCTLPVVKSGTAFIINQKHMCAKRIQPSLWKSYYHLVVISKDFPDFITAQCLIFSMRISVLSSQKIRFWSDSSSWIFPWELMAFSWKSFMVIS